MPVSALAEVPSTSRKSCTTCSCHGWDLIFSQRFKDAATARASARRPLHQLADLCLDLGSELLQGKRGGPDVTVVEVCSLLETQRRVSRLVLLPTLEEADNLAVLGVGGHAVERLGREGRRAGLDDAVDPFRDRTIRLRHLGDLREHVAFS